jgi:hypothetical protein
VTTRLGKIIIATAVGAGALGVGFGGSLAVASATTAHSSTPASTTSTSSTTGTTAANAGSAGTAATPAPSATHNGTHNGTHNCPNMKKGQGAPGSTSTGS